MGLEAERLAPFNSMNNLSMAGKSRIGDIRRPGGGAVRGSEIPQVRLLTPHIRPMLTNKGTEIVLSAWEFSVLPRLPRRGYGVGVMRKERIFHTQFHTDVKTGGHMPRISKKHPMMGSLKKGDEYKVAYFVWDEGQQGFFVSDKIAKKKYGPFASLAEANESGKVEFYVDFGRRSGIVKDIPAVAAAEPQTVA